MSTIRTWDRAAALPVPTGDRPRPELAALQSGLPTVAELFTFMRDAELRFSTLRMRIEERRTTTRGDETRVFEVTVRHPGDAKILTSEPSQGTAANYDIWISDGTTVRTYAARRKLGTERPVRARVRGVADGEDLPGMARIYVPLTPLQAESLPEVCIHPAGYCQNVLATGACTVTGTTEVGGREAIVLESHHPRTTQLLGDRPDFLLRLAVDRVDGVILRLEESIGGRITRDAVVTSYVPNAPLPPGAFDFTFPAGTTRIY